jgi:very-short-patch-repair endonuclease
MAAQLWLGDPASLSHASAAALWTLPGFPHGPVELSTPRPKKPLPPVVVHKVGVDLKRHTTTVGPLRVTNAGRTLADIAGCVSNEMLERCLEDVLRRRLTSVGHLRWLVRGRYGKGAKGVAKLQSLIDPGSRLTESDLEIRLLHAIRRASLPEPVRQYEIFHNGLLVARPDFAYPWAKVAIEADSYQFHSGRQAWEHDLRRRNALTSLGWLVIHVTHKQLESNVNEVVVRIREALLPSLAWHKE